MSEIPTRNDILEASAERGLLAYLFDIAESNFLRREAQLLATVAEVVGSGERTLFSDKDWAFLNGMSGPRFFWGMALLCELIPLLDVGHRQMMQLVAALVRLGGQDLAANQPNVAFRTWCGDNPAKVRAVLADARAGDSLAIDHLCFALEAEADSADAVLFLTECPEPKAQMGAATALGRMTLDAESAATALRSLSEVAIRTDNSHVRSNALLSSFAILEKNAELPRGDATRALDRAIGDTSAETLHALSTLTWMHGESLTADEVKRILNALQSVDPENAGTLEQIDHATSPLVSGGHFEALVALVAELTRRSQGKIGLDTFPSFRQQLVDDDSGRLGKLAMEWLLEGNPYLCSSLARQFGPVGDQRRTLDLQPDDIPAEPQEQLFVCRKAVGFLFPTPVAAASVLVAILRHGDHRITDGVLALLHDPLLTSYGDDLCRYLEEILKQYSEPGVVRIGEALTRKQESLDNIEGIDTLVELHPNESHRQIARVRWEQQMARAMEEGEKQSILHDLVAKAYVLYGSSLSSYTESPDGGLQLFNAEMRSHSFSVEQPQLDVFDPVGLEMTLLRFKYERRTAP